MDLDWLQDFLCLERTRNFTKAAQDRNVTQSAFSRRIRSLESWVGTALIDRARYPVELSETGERFLPVARRTVAQLLQARHGRDAMDHDGRRTIRFAAQHSISSNFLARELSALMAAEPALRTQVVSGNLVDCFERLASGDCDFVVCYRFPPLPLTLEEGRFAQVDLGMDRLVPVAGRDPARRHGWALPGASHRPLPHLDYERSSFLGSVVAHVTRSRAAALWLRHTDAFAEALKSMTLSGAGVAWLPESMIAAELAAGRLVRVGDAAWTAELKLSLFSAVELADASACRMWESLQTAAAPP